MAIEVQGKGKKKKEIKTPESLDIFLPISIALFVVMGASYFFLSYLTLRAEETGEVIRESIAEEEKKIPEGVEAEIREYSNAISDFKTVIEDHYIVSSFFRPFQNMTHPRIMMSNMSLNLQESSANFSGRGDGFVAVGQQFYVLKQRGFIENVELLSMNRGLDEDGNFVEFSFSIDFNPELFKF